VYQTVTLPSFDVWVVDNASSDGSVEMVRSKYPQVKLIESSSNEGFGRANNRAIKVSQGEMVLLLNSDVVLTAGAVDTIWQMMQKHSSLGALGCTLEWPDGGVQESRHTYIPHGPRLPKNRPPLSDGLEEVLLIWAAFLMVRREVFQTVGAFDEDFLLFYEDIDWCWRVHDACWTIACYPPVKVIHGSRQSAGKLPTDTYWRWMFTAEYLVYGKHHPALIHVLYMTRKYLSYTIKSYLHWLIYKITGSQLHKDVTRRLRIALSVIRALWNPKVISNGGPALQKLWNPDDDVAGRA